MLTSADLDLVERDPGLAGLPLLLDHEVLSTWLSERTATPCSVRSGRLRYKWATSCVLAFDLETGTDAEPEVVPCVAKTYTAEGAAKAQKSFQRSPAGTVVAVDWDLALVVTTLAGDRDLPALPRLYDAEARRSLVGRLLPDRPDLGAAKVRTLRHNPERRWVGLLEPLEGSPVVLRAYRAHHAHNRSRGYARLQHGSPRTPQLFGVSRRHNLTAVEWVTGAELSDVRDLDGFEAAGEALARLHGRPPVRLPASTSESESRAALEAARQIASLLPGLSAHVSSLGRRIASGLERAAYGASVLHGDFSADQVIRDAHGEITIIDLDSACLGSPAIDLGCAAAATLAHAEQAGLPSEGAAARDALYAGYSSLRELPDPGALALHRAAHRLRKASEPFRGRVPDWSRQMSDALAHVQEDLEPSDPARRSSW